MKEDLLLERYKTSSGYETIEVNGSVYMDVNGVKDLLHNIISTDILFGSLIKKYGSQVLTDEEISNYLDGEFNTKIVIREDNIVKLEDL